MAENTKSPKKDIVNRLSRIEGQVRGIKGMIEEDKPCLDVLAQIWAARAALHKAAELLMENYVKECLVKDQENFESSVEALVKAIKAIMS